MRKQTQKEQKQYGGAYPEFRIWSSVRKEADRERRNVSVFSGALWGGRSSCRKSGFSVFDKG